MLEGDPTARLTEASEDLDLLVCASCGRRPLLRLALAFSHGANDAAKSVGVIAALLVATAAA